METGKYDWKANKNAFAFALLYEFCGTALVVYAFNLSLQSAWIRAVAYFSAYIFAVHVSGSHFNPATSLAVFLTENKYKEQLRYFIAVMISQLCGAYCGILVSFMLAKDYYLQLLYPSVRPAYKLYFYKTFDDDDTTIFMGRIAF